MIRNLIFSAALIVGIYSFPLHAKTADAPTTAPSVTTPAPIKPGEKIPSEDDQIKDFHCLGLLDGRTDIFRSACPVRDLAKQMSTSQPSDEQLTEAETRMKHLYDLGIRTVISFQKAGEDGPDKPDEQGHAIALEQAAAQAVGVKFVSLPMNNGGEHSLETMSDAQVLHWLDMAAKEILADSASGGVDFHCSAGHDRTGIVAAYIRIKYQHWPVEEAIAEMRRDGHNWLKYSHNGGVSSWHEDHLRAIAAMIADSQ